ncbi:pyridoxamine 5'-phosphate oxidase family protein [Streptomyces sp. SCA3-4]|uniref:pyridoxamine 5'-phosphate oxidase family protein n=1 Tax=Streptomyces sichuanensis TaxID=2871810 RepID=UPI001CE2C57D|nr:pyridoxamine 5'-phosphate oxidase family protein [Streptomyces sichuanensis]MCA6092166.1 pyridoxamine 5'-phosphate oxidase family protein [Streptomyces sichuanensis]
MSTDLPLSTGDPAPSGPDAPRAEALFAAALRLVREHPYGFLTTYDGLRPHTRLVEHLGVGEDGSLHIGTSPRSRKAADVARQPRVTYAVEDRGAAAYVVLEAEAHVEDGLQERLAYWKDDFRAFFPAGPEGDDYVVLRLRPDRIELMDFTHEVHPAPFGLVPAVIERDADGWRRVPAARRAGPGGVGGLSV